MTSQLIIAFMLLLCSAVCGAPLSGHTLLLIAATVFISTTIAHWFHVRQSGRIARPVENTRDTLLWWCATSMVLLLFGWACGIGGFYDRSAMLAWFATTPIALLLHRRVFENAALAPSTPSLRRAVVVGANEVGDRMTQTCRLHPHVSIQVQGYFDDRSELNSPRHLRYALLGKMADVASYVRDAQIDLVFISQPVSAHPRLRQLIDDLHDTTASIYFLPDVYAFNLMQGRLDDIGGMPVIAVCETPLLGINSSIKRASDIVFALLLLAVFAPVMLAIALAIRLTSAGPAIFHQRRYGLDGKEIIIYKFRSMRVREDGATIKQAARNDPRVTKLGAFLRRSSLDELPQLINVLQGRMSIVGPRPHAVAHNELYRKLIKGYMLRHKVKPGITGWAQVNGLRGETATLDRMQARVAYDLAYLRDWSLRRDLWIMLLTIRTVLARDNAH